MTRNNRIAIVLISSVISLTALRIGENGFFMGVAFAALEFSLLFLAAALVSYFIDGGD